MPGIAGMHDVDDYPEAATVEGLVVYRYDSPLFFANAEDFRTRCLEPRSPRHLAGRVAADQHGGQRRGRPDRARRPRRAARRAWPPSTCVALARVKEDLRHDLDRFGLTEALGEDRLFPTLPTAVAAYARDFEARHGVPPPGAPPPL